MPPLNIPKVPLLTTKRAVMLYGVPDGDPHGELGMAGAMAKCFASDTAMQVTTDAVQVFGGAGYTTDFPVERIYRDVRVCQIYEGANDIQRLVIGRAIAAG